MKTRNFFVFLFIVLTTLVSCSDDSAVTDEALASKSNFRVANYSTIVIDTVFQNYLRDQYYSLERSYDILKVEDYVQDGVIDSTEEVDVHIAFGYSSKLEFRTFLGKQRTRLDYLRNNYGIHNFSTDDLVDVIDGGLNAINLPPNPGYSPLSCEEKRLACRKRVNATSLSAHAACLSIDVTTWPGVICHAAALAAQYYGLQECQADYKLCIEK